MTQPGHGSSLSLNTHRVSCPCGARPPLELRYDLGHLILARYCSRCDRVIDIRAKLEDWLALHQLVSVLLDQAQHQLPY